MSTVYPSEPEMSFYLMDLPSLNLAHSAITALVRELGGGKDDPRGFAEAAYLHVRDRISHSGDINAPEVPSSAPDVLAAGHGICLSKSLLLCALLRGGGVPCGFSLQRLREDSDNPESPVIHHVLNGLYLKEPGWFRVDARGNKPGVEARFSSEEERLAWPVRPESGEEDDPAVYPVPPAVLMDVLRRSGSREALYANWRAIGDLP